VTAPVRVALTDVFPPSFHSVVEAHTPAGWEVVLTQDPSESRRRHMIKDADFLFCGGAPTTDEMLRGAKRLKLVQKTGAGYNNINVELLKELDIGIANLPGNNAPAVAEHVVMLTLALLRRLLECDQAVRAGEWPREAHRDTRRELRGKVVGIVGFGHIGREVAARMRAFGTTLVYHDIVRPTLDLEVSHGVRFLELDELLQTADVVTLHVPLTPDTQHLIDHGRLDAMKSDALLINCARGPVVDEAALVAALKRDAIGGAGLDTFDDERAGGTEPFWTLKNVVLTPHSAGSTVDNFDSMMSRCFANAQSYLAGEPLPLEDVIWLPPR
jgi:phosphoglycerate dehydrogenase-like enzyme